MSLAQAAEAPLQVRIGSPDTRRLLVIGLGIVAVLASLPLWGDSGSMKFLVEFFVVLGMAQMWNLLAGYAGLVSIGQQAFVGIGAYGLFVTSDLVGMPTLLALVATAAFVAGLALLTSVFVFRLQGGYFAVGTWVVAEVFRLLVVQSKELGVGTGVTVHSLVQMPIDERQAITYWLALTLGVGSIVAVALIMRSRVGLALSAVRDSEVAARSLGVDIFRIKLLVYLIASIGCGIAGFVIYMQFLRIQPAAAFGVDWTAKMIFIVIIGGFGRIEGPAVGAIVFFALQETLADFGSLYLIVLGAVAIAVTLLAPRGLWGLISSRLRVNPLGVQRRLVSSDPGSAGGLR